MEPKEKAKKLHKKYMSVQVSYDDCTSGTTEKGDMDWDEAKQCALICVDVILNEIMDERTILGVCESTGLLILQYNKWQEVKQEIEKL